jgi:putative ABC transport system permease protein
MLRLSNLHKSYPRAIGSWNMEEEYQKIQDLFFSLLLQESVVITAISGYLGLVAGVGVIEGVSYFMEQFQVQTAYFNNPEVEFRTAIIATLVLVFTGALAGLIPAHKAASINPIEALRSE